MPLAMTNFCVNNTDGFYVGTTAPTETKSERVRCTILEIIKWCFEGNLERDFSQEDPSAIGIVDRLIVNAGLTQAKGRTLYTDNWYRSITLAKFLCEKYTRLFCWNHGPK